MYRALGRRIARTLIKDSKCRDQFETGAEIDTLHLVIPIGQIGRVPPRDLDVVAAACEDEIDRLHDERRNFPDDEGLSYRLHEARKALRVLKSEQTFVFDREGSDWGSAMSEGASWGGGKSAWDRGGSDANSGEGVATRHGSIAAGDGSAATQAYSEDEWGRW